MAKSLQEQLLSAGLTNKKKAKQAQREIRHQTKLKRTGQATDADATRERLAAQEQEKIARDKALNQQREKQAKEKAIRAQVKQLVAQNAIEASKADNKYQFVDGGKIKAIYTNRPVWERLGRGLLAIVATEAEQPRHYQVIPLAVADKIRERNDGYFIYIADNAETPDEDDPYAAFKIPDDLMW